MNISSLIENEEAPYYKNNKLWGMIKLSFPEKEFRTNGVDLVLVLDRSASMETDNKWAYIQATAEYIIDRLSENDRLSIIVFNHDIQELNHVLWKMTKDNKLMLIKSLYKIKPERSTNIGDAIFTAIDILRKNQLNSYRPSAIMLFTDGESNVGPRGFDFYQKLNSFIIPSNLSIHTFGYGPDHNPKFLKDISIKSNGGIYHYIESPEDIPKIMGECLASLLTTAATNISIRLKGLDGCRMLSFYTKFPIIEKKLVKDYEITPCPISIGESKTILFKMSIRKMNNEMQKHQLIDAEVNYTETSTGILQKQKITISIARTKKELGSTANSLHCGTEIPFSRGEKELGSTPLILDEEINRHIMATILSNIAKSYEKSDPKTKENDLLIIKESISKSHSGETLFCKQLINDLSDCIAIIKNSSGLSYIMALAMMYFFERPAGISCFKETHTNYMTMQQKKEIINSTKQVERFLPTYQMKDE